MSVSFFEELGKTLPERMEFETFQNKKEGYNQLVAEIKEAETKLLNNFNLLDASCYLLALAETLPVTSQEIYEHYRAIRDSFKRVMDQTLEKDCLSMSRDCRLKLGYAVLSACEQRAILTENYGQLADALIQSVLLTEGEAVDAGLLEKAEALSKRMKEWLPSGPYFPEVKIEEGKESGDVKLLVKTARSASFEIKDGGKYKTRESYKIFVNGILVKETDTVITSVYGLRPSTAYKLEVMDSEDEIVGFTCFVTKEESLTINVKELGAKGDGVSDDTKFIQAAILCCPPQGRVLIPAGVYAITSLFLKSHISVELAKGAELRADRDRENYVHFPASIELNDESNFYNLGTWEGNPLPMFAGIVSGIDVEDVTLYGEGCVNGNATKEDWWNNPKVMRTAFRPRTLFLSHCRQMTIQGVKFCNSPSWTLHPYFSEDLGFYNVIVENPSDSPNTDGLDPEACKNVEIAGVRFSLGDDCIAIKSGKYYLGKKMKKPSENLHIYQCLMENGHGAVTIGSEMAGGVKNLLVENCLFRNTDRGLRIKTRRGRGEDAIIDGVIFQDIDMDHVMTPFVVNSFYFCDPDGRTAYVQSRESMPVDDRTPYIKKLAFTGIKATNCHVAAAHFDGLPEQKIDEILMENVSVTYAKEPKCDVPAMSEGVEKCSLKGIFANNIKKLVLKNVSISGQMGEALLLQNVDEIVE